MKISARNVFDGSIEAVKPGAINSEVDVALPGGLKIVATVTRDSGGDRGLGAGKAVKALVKARSFLFLTDGGGVKLSARNRLEGTVTSLTEGPVSTEVAIGLPNGLTVYATITRDGATAIGLKVGVPAAAVFKAPSVIIGVAA